MSKKALITGVTGQDGSYLAELLLEKGYEVHGMVRRSSVEKRERIDHLEGNPNFTVHYGDLSDSLSLVRLIGSIKPDEIYNLAAQSRCRCQLLMCRNIQQMLSQPEYSECLRQSVSVD